MAEEFGDKTHEATPYRRQKAREEGQVVKSQDLASAAVLLAAILILCPTKFPRLPAKVALISNRRLASAPSICQPEIKGLHGN